MSRDVYILILSFLLYFYQTKNKTNTGKNMLPVINTSNSL